MLSNILVALCDDLGVFHTDSTTKIRILVIMSQSLVWFKIRRRDKRIEKLFEAKELLKK
jgi:hypothetical protein